MGARSLADLRDGTERPEIAPPRRWMTRVVVPGVLLAGMAGMLGASAWGALRPAVDVDAEIVVAKATTSAPRAGSAVVQAAGWVEADPYMINATALTDGVVAEMLVLEGERVAAGQVLARLVDDDARLALRQAEASLAQARAMARAAEVELEAAQSRWDNPTGLVRMEAAARAMLDEALAAELRIDAEIAAARADAEQARSEHDRVRPLGESETVSEQEVIDARTKWEAAEARAEALAQMRQEAAARVQNRRADLKAAEEDLRLRIEDRQRLGAAEAALERARADVLHAQAALDEARLRVERLEVRSPADGVVVERLKAPGSKVMLGGDDMMSAVIARLYDPAKIQVRVDVPLADAAAIAVGQPCEVIVDVLPGVALRGEVTRVLHVADIQKNTLQAKVAILDPRPELRPEMLARVRFLEYDAPATSDAAAGETRTALHAPAAAITNGQAWLVTEFDGKHGVARQRAIEAGPEQAGWVEVASGLNPGDLLVTRSAATLEEGARVRLRPATQGANNAIH